jgi:hypothetical protein
MFLFVSSAFVLHTLPLTRFVRIQCITDEKYGRTQAGQATHNDLSHLVIGEVRITLCCCFFLRVNKCSFALH